MSPHSILILVSLVVIGLLVWASVYAGYRPSITKNLTAREMGISRKEHKYQKAVGSLPTKTIKRDGKG